MFSNIVKLAETVEDNPDINPTTAVPVVLKVIRIINLTALTRNRLYRVDIATYP